MKKSLHTVGYLSFILSLLHGCTALHVPQSEVILIEKPSEPEEIAAGLSVNSGLWNKQIKSFAIEEHLQDGLQEKVARRNFYGVSLTGLLGANQHNALGISLGSGGLGLDYTQSISQKIYITAIGNAARNIEGIVQIPVYRTSKSGFAIGGFYRNERHGLLAECTTFFCVGNDVSAYYRVSAFGIRLNQYIDDGTARLRLRFSIGYSPELKGIVITGGLHSSLPRRAFDKGAYCKPPSRSAKCDNIGRDSLLDDLHGDEDRVFVQM